jgi:integrase/recombinase XerD
VSVRVQRVGASAGGEVSYTVTDSDGLPVGPVEAYLAHLSVVGRAPNTVAGYAHDLRDYVEWLDLRGLDYRAVSLEQVGEFFGWLRRPKPARRPGVFALPSAPPAVVGRTLARKRAALAGFYRFHARRDGRCDPVLGEIATGTGGFVPMLAHTRHGRRGEAVVSPLRIPDCSGPVARDLTPEAFGRLLAACVRRRDRFLLVLLEQTGLRLGEALGLRHSDLRLRAGEVRVVPRRDNANRARVKGLKPRTVPVDGRVLDAYADYMETEYGTLDSDYVFVNLFRAPLGAAMTASTVHKLAARLRHRSGVAEFTPHTLRHTMATRLLRAGVDAAVVAELLGHASSQTTTSTYGHLRVEDHRLTLIKVGALEERPQW